MAGVEMDFKKIMDSIGKTAKDQINKGLDKAAERYLEALAQKSPSSKKSRSKYKNSWKVSRRYHNVRIIHNTKMVQGKKGKIPLVNILEPEGKFAQKLLEEMRPELTDIILNEIQFD